MLAIYWDPFYPDIVPTLMIQPSGAVLPSTVEVTSANEVHESCSVVWKNQMLIFGGEARTKQIVQIIDCKLEIIGQLEFGHSDGGCTVNNDDEIFLCFNKYRPGDFRQCRKASAPLDTFTEIETTRFLHNYGRVASNDGESLNLKLIKLDCSKNVQMQFSIQIRSNASTW